MTHLTEAVQKARCWDCDGMGIVIGPVDKKTGEPRVRDCRSCDGNGIHITMARRLMAKGNGHADLAQR